MIVQLLKGYCLPFLLYASEAVSPSHSIVHSLDNCINRAIVKIFQLLAVTAFRRFAILLANFTCGTQLKKKRLKFVSGLLNDIRFTRLFTARCDASAVFAVMQCLSVRPSVRLSVRHVRRSRQNEQTYLRNFFTIG